MCKEETWLCHYFGLTVKRKKKEIQIKLCILNTLQCNCLTWTAPTICRTSGWSQHCSFLFVDWSAFKHHFFSRPTLINALVFKLAHIYSITNTIVDFTKNNKKLTMIKKWLPFRTWGGVCFYNISGETTSVQTGQSCISAAEKLQ